MKCKVINTGKNLLEIEVNEWLSSGQYEIVNVVQSQESSYITLTIFYLEKKDIRKKKLNKIINK